MHWIRDAIVFVAILIASLMGRGDRQAMEHRREAILETVRAIEVGTEMAEVIATLDALEVGHDYVTGDWLAATSYPRECSPEPEETTGRIIGLLRGLDGGNLLVTTSYQFQISLDADMTVLGVCTYETYTSL